MQQDPHHAVAAALWMMGSVLSFSAVAVAGRELGGHLDTFEMMLYRSVIGFVLLLLVISRSRRWSEITLHRFGLHLFRNLVHFAGQNLWLYALALIPMAQLFAIEFSSPIIVALAAPFFLSERLTRTKLLTATLGFAGILMVARPFGGTGDPIGLLAALGSAVSFAGVAIITKKLTRETTVLCILFWLTLMQAVLGLLCAGLDGQIRLPGTADLPWVLLLGVTGLTAHLSLTRALSLAPASVVTPLDFLRLPLIGIVGMLAYQEPLDPWVFIGGAVIFAANWVNIRADARYRQAT